MRPAAPEIPRAWTIALVIAAAALALPFAGWLVLAIWLSGFARGFYERLVRKLGREHVSALIVVVLMMMVLVPVGAVLTSLVIDAIALISQLLQSDAVRSAFVTLVSNGGGSHEGSLRDLVLSQGERAWTIARMILMSAARISVGLAILVIGVYAILIDGRRWYAWAEAHLPVGPRAVRRFSAAFVETGRGLAFGVLGAGFLQAVCATVAYLVLGVPQALALGLLTLAFSIVPLVGTAAVWIPVAAGLAFSGRLYAGIGMAVFGVLVIGSIDNVARPWLTRYGKLQLPMFVVLVAMFGAVELFGGWGILFGPLIVRLAKEALEVRRDATAAPGASVA